MDDADWCSFFLLQGGNYVTLGHMERSDLECVLDYLGQREWVSCIALYGRSMGAATALLVASSDRSCRTISQSQPRAF